MVKQQQFWLISGRLSHQQVLTVTNQRHKLKQKNCEHLKSIILCATMSKFYCPVNLYLFKKKLEEQYFPVYYHTEQSIIEYQNQL